MDNVEQYFGPCLDYRQLDDAICDLYQMGIDIVDNALSSALFDTGEMLQAYPFAAGYPLEKHFNAGTCDCDRGGSVVAINASVPVLILNACLAYSTRVDVVTGLPQASVGKLISWDSRLNLLGELPYAPESPADFNNLFEKIITADEYQQGSLAYALVLYEIAIRHIVLGHTGYLKKKLSLNVFMEFFSARETQMDRQLSHCLEFLSDQHAVRGIASKMLNGEYRSEASALLLEDTSIPTQDYLVRGIVTALSIVFHLFPSDEVSLKSPIYSHPNPYLRMQWIAMEIGHEVGSRINYHDAVMLPTAWVSASLHANFQTPGNWRYFAEEDLETKVGSPRSFSDSAYQEMLNTSKQWRNTLWKEYSPLYRNDGSGRLDDP